MGVSEIVTGLCDVALGFLIISFRKIEEEINKKYIWRREERDKLSIADLERLLELVDELSRTRDRVKL